MNVNLNGKIIQTPCAWCSSYDPIETHSNEWEMVKICKSCHLGAHCFIDTEHRHMSSTFDFAEFYLESAPMPYYKRVVYNSLKK